MTSALTEKLTGVRDLKKILETTVKELSESFAADACQIVLSNPLDKNITTLCEYRVNDVTDETGCLRLPIALQGNAQGYLALSRKELLSADDINSLRVIMAELADIIRHSQITDIVQRDTFRDTFLVEIGNVMTYSLGIGDALFMVVNILGKVLNVSRCLFICTDDSQAGWRCYEYSQQGAYPSCRDFRWPTTDSTVVAHTLLSNSPIVLFEGQENSYITPMQEELQFIGARSCLGVPLKNEGNTLGCVILQQCDWRRSWTRHEIDMVQAVSDKVAEALAKLPAEKLAREPIMQLHQRVVTAPVGGEEKEDIRAVRRALKEALGQKSIPEAQKTSVPQPASQAAAATVPPPPPEVAEPEVKSPEPPLTAPLSEPVLTEPVQSEAAQAEPFPTMPSQQIPAQSEGQGQGSYAVQNAWGDEGQAPEPGEDQSLSAPVPSNLGSILGGIAKSTPTHGGPAIDFGEEVSEAAPVEESSTAGVAFIQEPAEEGFAPVPPLPPPSYEEVLPPLPPPLPPPPPKMVPVEPIPADAIELPPPAASVEEHAPKWSDLDSIPTPSSGPAQQGLGSAMFGKPKGPTGAAQGSSLLASLHKDKTKFQGDHPEFVEGPPIQIDDEQAQAKLDELLSAKNLTSDYIFATPGVDIRMLGRIDGWITQIEQKDKYVNGHARQVAEYAQAIAKQIGMAQVQVDEVRLAALVHDVGKLGAPQEILQKSDDQLSDDELLLVMRHPLDGADLLQSFPELANLATIVRAHHEEFDGNGYPVGLAGEDIPLAARIIAVADSYHAMVSDLTYRKGLDPQKAQEELTKGANKQWDARCVEALILCLMQQLVPAKF